MATFPDAFSDLEPFADWALPTEEQRYTKRLASTMDELQAFYDAVYPRLDDICQYLEGVEMAGISDEDAHLLWLGCAHLVVSFPIEVWSQPKVPDSGSCYIWSIHEPAV
ncbi:MAG: hypothetical protein U5K30_10465 [Acidimicrobiales bacterium]|nr:hypothetical protein [Acidimicrobiales bacterium]